MTSNMIAAGAPRPASGVSGSTTLDRIRKHAKLRQEYAQQTQQPKPDSRRAEASAGVHLGDRRQHPRSVAAILGQGDGGRAWQCEIAVLDRHIPTVRQADECRHQGAVERRQIRNQTASVGVLSARRHRQLHHDVGSGAAVSPRTTLTTRFCRWQRRTASRRRSCKTTCCAS